MVKVLLYLLNGHIKSTVHSTIVDPLFKAANRFKHTIVLNAWQALEQGNVYFGWTFRPKMPSHNCRCSIKRYERERTANMAAIRD